MHDLFDKKTIINNLLQLGLSRKESVVYISLFELGETGTTKIARNTGLHGQFVYKALDTLERKGLVQHAIINGRKKFSAKDPGILISLADQQKNIAEDVRQKILKSFVMAEEQDYQISKGQDAFIAEQLLLANKLNKGDILRVIGGDTDIFVKTMGKYIEEYDYARRRRNIPLHYIGSELNREHIESEASERDNFKIRLLPGKFSGQLNTGIYNDSVIFIIFADTPVTFRITNKKIAEGYAQFFDTLWALGK